MKKSAEQLDGLSPGLWAYHFLDSTALKPTMSDAGGLVVNVR
jgi:hypothetical protein